MIHLIEKSDPLLLNFRKKVIFQDCRNFPLDVFEKNYSYDELKNIVNNETFEGGWKFTNPKFNSTKWNHILGQILDNEIVTFSGSILHQTYLKVGVFHYFIKEHRKNISLRGSLFRKDGFIENHIKNTRNVKGCFFTVYAHNIQLARYIKYLKERKYMFESHDMSLINNIKFGGEINYKGVEQSLFYLPITNDFNLEELKYHVSCIH